MEDTSFILPLVRERCAFDKQVSAGVHAFGARQIKEYQESSIRKSQQLHKIVSLICYCLGHKIPWIDFLKLYHFNCIWIAYATIIPLNIFVPCNKPTVFYFNIFVPRCSWSRFVKNVTRLIRAFLTCDENLFFFSRCIVSILPRGLYRRS